MKRFVFLALFCALVLGVGGTPSNAASPARSAAPQDARFSQGALDAGVAVAARKKKKKKKKKKKRARRTYAQRCWPGIPAVSTARVLGAVQYRWGTTACTTRYRVRISPAWWGSWPGAPWYTPYVSGSARSTTWRVPATPRPGDGMLGVAYANPVFAQLEANNAYNTRYVATRKAQWVAQWPWAPAPAPGSAVRFGSYNVAQLPANATRAAAAARNIGAHGVTMAALQEAKQSGADSIVDTLNASYAGSWTYVRASGATVHDPAQQIIYRSDLFTLRSSGVLSAGSVKAPWASFTPVGSTSRFYVTSLHFPGTSTSSWSQNASTGANARGVINYMGNLTNDPVIAAGDLRYGREPWGDRPGYVPAQPTFVRNGYYDAMASQSKRGHNYSTVNGFASQRAHRSGAGPRADHILMRGIVGSRAHVNVANWSYGGTIPSDHNLIYSDILIPE